jgi:hypothetical protein
MDTVGHPLEELECSLIVGRSVELWGIHALVMNLLARSVQSTNKIRVSYMASELLIRRLRSRGTVEINDGIDTILLAPPDNTVKIGEAPAGVILVCINKALSHPEADGNAHGIQANLLNLLDIGLGNPRVPVIFPDLVSLGLTEGLDAIPLVVPAVAAHVLPAILRKPLLDDELGAEVYTADLARLGQPALCQGASILGDKLWIVLLASAQ